MGDRLRKIRRDHLGGISQERMAELLEVPRERYAQWERGGGNPRLSEAKRIAEILMVEAGVPVAWTLGFTHAGHPALRGLARAS